MSSGCIRHYLFNNVVYILLNLEAKRTSGEVEDEYF